MSEPLHLDPASVDAIARRVAELLAADAPTLLDAAAVARRVGRGRAWVYDHAVDLGAVRLGGGERPRLGFEPSKVAEYLDACKSSRRTREPEKRATERRMRRAPTSAIGQGDGLLPIRGVVPPR